MPQLLVRPVSGDGICTRDELVSKIRPISLIETYSETYNDGTHSCRWYGRCPSRRSSHWVYKQQEFRELETKKFCCTGYVEREQKDCYGSNCELECDPVCDFICFFGKCAGPNLCLCDPGYSKHSGTDNICDPVCSEPCANGFCSKPEFCSCDKGYEKDPSDKYSCRPVCTPVCVNANCTSPNTCSCYSGYKKVTDDPYKCHAHCSKPCLNAVCTKPEECSCLLGYQKDQKDSNLCNPVCSEDCVNGKCTGPEECTCFGGYASVGNYSCGPVCTSCLNAFCSEPEVCKCFPGHEPDVNDKSVCLPVCSPQCSSGNCTAPNTCECFPGFEETDNPAVCKPYCSDGCENGVCTEPENCTCLWGFHSESDSSYCSLTNENHDCTFVNELTAYDDDKSCFKVEGDISLAELKNCKILQNLVAHFIQQGTSVSLINLNCGGVSFLRKIESYLFVDLFCDVSMDDVDVIPKREQFEVTDESEVTLYLTSDSDSTDQSDYVYRYSSTEMDLLIASNYINEEQSDRESFVTSQKQDTTLKKLEGINNEEPRKASPTQEGFKMIWKNDVTDPNRIKFSDFSISLNITAQFLPMIRGRHLTINYFNHSKISLLEDWCLCHRNKTWKLCAGEQTQLFLCPCTPSNIARQLAVSATWMPALLILVLSLMCVFVLVLVIFHIFNKLRQFGNYYTSTREMAEASNMSILPSESSDVCTSSQETR